jgi:hypothetical protein
MTTRNDITGDEIKTKEITDKYRENFDKIFRKPEPLEELNKAAEENGEEL